MNDSPMKTIRVCGVCGKPMAADDLHGRCPECLSTVPPVSADETLSERAPPRSGQQIATSALEGRADGKKTVSRGSAIPLPLHARALLEKLGTIADWSALIGELKLVLQKPPSVSRRRRVSLAVACLFPLAALAALPAFFVAEFPLPALHRLRAMKFFSILWLLVALVPSVFAASSARWRLWQSLGMVLVRADGTPASRARVFLRQMITWSGLMLFWMLPALLLRLAPLWGLIASVLFAAIVAYSTLARPERGLQDRILGTWLVPL